MPKRFRTDDLLPQSGINYVYHEEHRLIRTVRLYVGDRFPRCSRCKKPVKFELILEVMDSPAQFPIRIFEVALQSEAEDAPKTPRASCNLRRLIEKTAYADKIFFTRIG